VGQILVLGALLGAGAAFAVGPIFVIIVQQAATRGLGAALRVILGSATADVILLVPALSFAWVIGLVVGAALWVSLVGAAVFLFLGQAAARDAVRIWRSTTVMQADGGWAFWKGVLGNLANPLSWTFWLATGTPTMLRAREIAGLPGLIVFTVTWFAVAVGIEALIASAVVFSGRVIGPRGLATFSAISALMFLVLASTLLATNVLPAVLHSA
jgi:threonine/homoserine/homoserine lactone efflux protein